MKISRLKKLKVFFCFSFGMVTIVSPVSIFAGLSGFITSDTTFTIDNSPYSIDGDVFISDGVTVTINPGVTFQFKANSDLEQSGDYSEKSEIIIYGTLIAEGKSDSIISFKSYFGSNVAGEWGQIKTDLQGKLYIQYASVKYSKNGINIYNSAQMEMRVENCDFQNIEEDAIKITSGNITKSFISTNTFTSVGRAVYSSRNNAYCSYNSINNSVNGIQVAGYSIISLNNFSTLSGWGCSAGISSKITDNIFQNITGNGISVTGYLCWIIGNNITDVSGVSIHIGSNNNSRIYGNFINGNANDGIYFGDNGDVNTVQNNIIINCKS